ncbi:hypothetical protein BDF20DRAFT_916177 [Mycotypha africana]|uniref:uncharacterized protein n=1 Tax=Mycotypha africana TaxID=64632 RepID=UPI0023015BDE|nr:uncharacterized protein BDF20DRAFT_916177 [Mycotypha africana]KAI8970365.1 hypothetical protein BDF20DRAFT_916177 [Mycotypha africana]
MPVKTAIGKKRHASNNKLQRKPPKALKTSNEQVEAHKTMNLLPYSQPSLVSVLIRSIRLPIRVNCKNCLQRLAMSEKVNAALAQLEQESEGLFDNLDEKMDDGELEEIIKQINSENESDTAESSNENGEESESDSDEANTNAEVEDVQEEENNDEMDEDKDTNQQSTTNSFRNLYMTNVTQAFGSDLDQIRQEPNFDNVRLNILIDSLEAGIDIYSKVEQEIILADDENKH